MKNRISAVLLAAALASAASGAVFAQDKTIKIGVLTDNSGLYSDLGGAGSTLAAQMAVEDSGLAVKGWKIDVISADHQNKPDIATNIARQWIDVEKVDIFMDVRCWWRYRACSDDRRKSRRSSNPWPPVRNLLLPSGQPASSPRRQGLSKAPNYR